MAVTKAYVGRNTAVGIDQYDLTGQGNEVKAKRDAAVVDATGFGSRFSYDLAGIQKASIELKGHYAPGETLDVPVNKRFGQDSDVLAWYAPLGLATLNPMVMQPSVITKYDLDSKLKGEVAIDMMMMARGYVDDGFIMVTPNAYTSVTGTGSVLDNTATGGATTSGGAAQMHIWSATGTTPSVTMKIQHSPDGTTWTDLITFAAATAAGSQRFVLPTQTTVNAQVRAQWTVTGTTPQFTALVGFARGVTYS